MLGGGYVFCEAGDRDGRDQRRQYCFLLSACIALACQPASGMSPSCPPSLSPLAAGSSNNVLVQADAGGGCTLLFSDPSQAQLASCLERERCVLEPRRGCRCRRAAAAIVLPARRLPCPPLPCNCWQA